MTDTPANAQLDLLPASTELDGKALIAYLQGRGWRTAAAVCADCGMPATDANKRQVRTLAENSKGEIGSGQKGYKLVRDMTKDELDHCCNWMLSQASRMKSRVMAMQRVFYRRQAA